MYRRNNSCCFRSRFQLYCCRRRMRHKRSDFQGQGHKGIKCTCILYGGIVCSICQSNFNKRNHRKQGITRRSDHDRAIKPPVRSSATPLLSIRREFMICPCCNNSFPLTWRRYASSPFGKHTCPSCQSVSKFKFLILYFTLMIFAWIVYLVVIESVMTRSALRQSLLKLLGGYYYLLLFIIGLGLIFPLDKLHDERFKKLVKLRSKGK